MPICGTPVTTCKYDPFATCPTVVDPNVIIGTPVTTLKFGPFVVSPPVTNLYNTPVVSKMRAGVIRQAQFAKLQVQIFDMQTLTPVNLYSLYGLMMGPGPQGPQGVQSTPTYWLKFRFIEALGLSGCTADADLNCVEIVDPANGIIACVVPSLVVGNSGVYLCEAGIFDPNSQFIYSNNFYVLVDRGLFTNPNTSTVSNAGPPSINEIRINLRDQPEINRLIDEFEFDGADICDAIVRAVMQFNMAQPPVNVHYNTINFPYRYQWMDGIAAHLYEYAAGYYRRNQLKHQTAGLSVDDLNREREYLQAWQMRNERWTKWVQAKKVELNMAEGFGTISSPYASTHGYRGAW